MTAMIWRGWVVFVVLCKCVFSTPVSPSHMDDEDVKVIKCIVEVLADVLSKPQSIPVSQECLQTLRTDDRLVTILRHRNFLHELQDIAEEGANERAEKRMKDDADYVSRHPEHLDTPADQSMLVAMERPGESAEKRRDTEEENDGESKETEEEKGKDGVQEDKRAGMMKGDKREEEEEKLSSSEEEEDETAGAGEHPEIKKSAEEEEEEEGSQEEQEKVENKREDLGHLEEKKKTKAGVKHWSHPSQLAHRRAEMSVRSFDQKEAPHHSKEVPGQGEGEVWKSPEERELQMMAQREPEDRREEEGSASKKTEDGEIESLAAIESELENVAQKLHELRRG